MARRLALRDEDGMEAALSEEGELRSWARRFRAEAKSDRYRLARKRAEEDACATSPGPRAAVDATVQAVALVVAYHAIDSGGQAGSDAFLRKQVYDHVKSGARYVLTFEIGAFPFFQILVDELREVDLADLFAFPGFRHLNIARVDGGALATEEREMLLQAVQSDFGYDYEEGELRLDFCGEGLLQVVACESEGGDQDEVEERGPDSLRAFRVSRAVAWVKGQGLAVKPRGDVGM